MNARERAALAARAKRLSREGVSNGRIATALGVSRASVAGYLADRRYTGMERNDPDRSDFSRRPGPIRCICGAPAACGTRRPSGKASTDGIPWGFCSIECSDGAVERIAWALGESRRQDAPGEV